MVNLSSLINKAKKVDAFVKKNKSASKILSALGQNKLASQAASMGRGRRRRRRRAAPMIGGRSLLSKIYRSVVKPLHKVVKQSGIVGNMLPGPAGTLARVAGYGRRRRRSGAASSRRRVIGMGMRQRSSNYRQMMY